MVEVVETRRSWLCAVLQLFQEEGGSTGVQPVDHTRYSTKPINHPNFRLVPQRLPFGFQGLQDPTDEVFVGGGFLADVALAAGQTVAVFTSRQLVTVDDHAGSLSIGRQVSDGLIEIVQSIRSRPRYLVAKGGITSSDTATAGLGVVRAIVAGQILPGVPVWRTGAESRHPGLAYVVFPGNVGGDDALVEVARRLG